jgi:ribose transport system substrate-binding protein
MKRSLAKPAAGATAVLLLTLTAAACSSSSSSSASGGSSATGGSTGGSTSGKNYKMTFIQGVAGDGFYVTMGCGIQAEAKKLGNITVNIQGPTQFDATLQNPIIGSVTAAKPDAILIAPNDVSASRPPIAAAMAAGIKVVLVDTTLSDPSGAVSQISSDNVAGGTAAFTAIKQLVPGGGQVLVVNVKPGVSTTDQRQQGFATAAQADSKFKYVGTQFDQDSASVAAQVTLAALQKNPGIVGIFAANLFSAEGAATGVRQGQDHRLRRRAGRDHRAPAGHGAGSHRPVPVHHRDRRGGPGLRGPDRQGDHRQDRHQVHHHHQGQPQLRGQPGGDLQDRLLIQLLTPLFPIPLCS